jgi:hypothetical protein
MTFKPEELTEAIHNLCEKNYLALTHPDKVTHAMLMTTNRNLCAELQKLRDELNHLKAWVNEAEMNRR